MDDEREQLDTLTDDEITTAGGTGALFDEVADTDAEDADDADTSDMDDVDQGDADADADDAS